MAEDFLDIEDISFELRAESILVRRAMQKHGGARTKISWAQPDRTNTRSRSTLRSFAN